MSSNLFRTICILLSSLLFLIDQDAVHAQPRLSAEDIKRLEHEAKREISKLDTSLNQIVNHSNSNIIRLRAIESARHLFLSDESNVQICIHRPTHNININRTIREYLNNLYKLPDDNIQIQWSAYYSNFHLIPDRYGNYYGTAILKQLFIRHIKVDGKIIYQSETDEKIISVVVKKEKNQKDEYDYNLYLGDISVKQKNWLTAEQEESVK